MSGELALERFLRGIFDAMESMMVTEVSAGVTISAGVDPLAPQISTLEASLTNDVTARIEMLEKGTYL